MCQRFFPITLPFLVTASLVACVDHRGIGADEVPRLTPAVSLAQTDGEEQHGEDFNTENLDTKNLATGDKHTNDNDSRRTTAEAVANLDVYQGLEAKSFAVEPELLRLSACQHGQESTGGKLREAYPTTLIFWSVPIA